MNRIRTDCYAPDTMRLINNSGLPSESNLCYVNSAVQMLNNVPRIKNLFGERVYKLKGEENRVMKICDELARLFNAEGTIICSAAELRQLVGTASNKHYFKDGSQQDILDFMFSLLEAVEEEISDLNWETKVVIREFRGREKTEKMFLNSKDGKCGQCKKLPRVEEENFKYLQVDVPDTSMVIPLSGLVNSYFQESSDTFQMKCSNCSPSSNSSNSLNTGTCKLKEVVSKKVLTKGPDVLVVQVNRFSGEDHIKIKTTVWPDDILKMKTGEEYKLNSIAYHLGETNTCGHYLVSVNKSNVWMKCNDTELTTVTESEVKSGESYICIYTKQFNQSTPFFATDEWQDIRGRTVPGLLHYSFGSRGNYAKKMSSHPKKPSVVTRQPTSVYSNIKPKRNYTENATNMHKKTPECTSTKSQVVQSLVKDQSSKKTNLEVNESSECHNCREMFRNLEDHLKKVTICGQTHHTKPTLHVAARKRNQQTNKTNSIEKIEKVDPSKNVNRFNVLEDLEECSSCGKEIKLLFSHLKRSQKCQAHYDMDLLQQENF